MVSTYSRLCSIIKVIDFRLSSLADLGSGAGFPGLVVEIFNKNKSFHVKLYEKSPVKRAFLNSSNQEFRLRAAEVLGDIR